MVQQTSNSTQSLSLYKASAGSGKTFRLAVEYIRLLIINPENYRHILAVTFTNKATAEMKLRILSQLYGIAHSLPDSDSYVDALRQDDGQTAHPLTRIDEAEIRRRAAMALDLIIHDYSRVHIETIDSFFHAIVCELAHDLHLNNNLRLELSDADVLQEAVADIIDDLPDNKPTFEAVMEMINAQIEQSKNWQIASDLQAFGKHIFSDAFHSFTPDERAAISDAHRMSDYRQMLCAQQAKILAEMAELGNAFLAFLQNFNVPQDEIKNVRHIHSFFTKMADRLVPDVTAAMRRRTESVNEWMKADSGLWDDQAERLRAEFTSTLGRYDAAVSALGNVRAILQNVQKVRLLTVIDAAVRELNKNANRFLLADAAPLLHAMIRDCDVPFVYERVGVQLRHIMIDEFQDTSGLQWENFKPLLHNSMSTRSDCLIVGDVKQSIYRWRGGDWQILNDIDNAKTSALAPFIFEIKHAVNHRSDGRVVAFNSDFFERAAQWVADRYDERINRPDEPVEALQRAFASVRQEPTERHRGRGYVQFVQLPDEKTDEADSKIIQLNCVADTVERLLGAGVQCKDIAILLRTNAECQSVTQMLAQRLPDVRVVSSDAYRLDGSVTVRLIISALRVVADPTERLYLVQLVWLWHKLRGTATCAPDPNDICLRSDESLRAALPPAFADHLDQAAATPLYTLVEQIYAWFGLDGTHGEDAWMFYFFDALAAWTDKAPVADLASFLTYWDDKLCAATLPESVTDGLRVMTIHKSKGLEFHSVIVPFCDKSMDGRPGYLLWSRPDTAPYDQMPVVAVNYQTMLEDTIFAEDYHDELLRNYVDSLNTLYVAFTRAVHNLFIIADKPTPEKRQTTTPHTRDLLPACLPKDLVEDIAGQPINVLSDEAHPLDFPCTVTANSWVTGDIVPSQETKKAAGDNVLLRPDEPVEQAFFYGAHPLQFRQSNESAAFIAHNDDDPQSEAQLRTTYINRGNVLHYVLSLVRSPEDLDRAIRQADHEGLFGDTSSHDEARVSLARALRNPEARRWFAPGLQVINECAIIERGADGLPHEQRPDRVIIDGTQCTVIDYKTGIPLPANEAQVKAYIRLLRLMGYENVSGRLWYLATDTIIEVNC